MPTYDYVCTSCGHLLEVVHPVHGQGPSACPVCGKDALQKRVSKVAFRLKGTGWYETDFKNKGGDKKTETATGDGAAASDKGAKEGTAEKSGKDSKESSTGDAKTTSGGGESKKVAAKSDD